MRPLEGPGSDLGPYMKRPETTRFCPVSVTCLATCLVKQGAVDANCRVHGIGNLSVAGASVYPTVGFANSTLTLDAVSLRLSDHLRTTRA